MVDVVVVGSINMDLVVQTQRAPRSGETIAGTGFKMVPGGKGANQAVAISRLGASTAMIGNVGDDAFGPISLDSLKASHVVVDQVRCLHDFPSGTATIIVDESGENRIIIIAGANGQVSRAQVDEAESLIQSAQMVVMQFEIPLHTVEYAIEKAHADHKKVLLNPAPAYPIPDHIFPMVDYLVVNETEAEMLSGKKVEDVQTAFETGRALNERGAGAVVVTLGANGAVLVSDTEQLHVPALKVKAVDTTAAGDSFVGGFTVSLIKGRNMRSALEFAVAAGSLAVTKLGAQPSIPTEEEVINYLSR